MPDDARAGGSFIVSSIRGLGDVATISDIETCDSQATLPGLGQRPTHEAAD